MGRTPGLSQSLEALDDHNMSFPMVDYLVSPRSASPAVCFPGAWAGKRQLLEKGQRCGVSVSEVAWLCVGRENFQELEEDDFWMDS